MVSPNRRTILKGIVAGGASLGVAAPVSAKPDKCQLNWRKELSKRKGKGRPVVNVTQEVVNDIDSGFHGFWAYDDYRRHIQMWESGDDFVAIVQYNGHFDAVEGRPSPMNGDPLSGDENGVLLGGYAGTLTGDLVSDPDWSTRGFVGTFDYEGDVETGQRPGAVDWTQIYVDGDFSFDWWGWIYRGGECGTWVNAQPGSCGEILCE